MPDRARLLQFLREWALMAQGVALVAFLGGRWWWPLDLANHFVPHYALLALLGLAAATASRAPRTGALLALALAAHAVRIVPERAPPADGVPLRVLLANVFTANTDHGALLDLVRAEDPDVVALLEVNARWVAALAPLRADRPHVVEEPREDNFGLALYSRIALTDVEVRELASAPVPTVTARLHGVRLVLTHPLPPIGARYATLRDEQLAAVAALRDDRTVIAGDLNATPWSSAFPGRRPGWRPGTWPAGLPAPMRIPIDHVLAGPGVRIERLRAGPDVGSDHRPLIADLVVPPS